MTWAGRLAKVVVLATPWLANCGGEPHEFEVGHGVLVLAIDGLRADHVGTFGSDRDTTPHLDALAARGVAFESALAAAPLWFPATSALLSGCDPNMARRQLPGFAPTGVPQLWFASSELPNLAVELAVAGFDTAAFVDSAEFDEHTGLARGFQSVRHEDDPWERRERGPLELCAEWIRSRPVDADWFCFVQTSDLLRAFEEPHPEWDGFFEPRPELEWVPPVGAGAHNFHALPRERWEGGTVTLGRYEARYDGALRRLDAALQRLFDSIEIGGRFKRTTVVVIGTHGLQFGEAGLVLDHGLYSPADVHVPLVVRPAIGLAARTQENRRVRELVSSTDIAPTLLELCGVPVPSGVDGESLVPRFVGEPPAGAHERVVVVSCGLVLGMAAYGENVYLEHLFPGFESTPALLDQWLGGAPIEGIERRCVPWRTASRDLLLFGPEAPAGHEVEAERLAQHLSTWFEEFVIPRHRAVWGGE
jgi:arylsulfatase A-like enzyme